MLPAGNGGTIELVYMQVSYMSQTIPFVKNNSALMCTSSLFLQMYAPTTLVPARDFWTLRYTTTMDDGSLVVRIDLNTLCLLDLLTW